MPRDRRLYMTFPIDFDEHPKVLPLSDAAFRAFVEMNAYSRRNDLDGRIPAVVAKLRWKSRVLAELVASHDERPLVLLDGATYVLREYREHQFTLGDLESLRQKRSEAGAKGAAKRWHKDAKPVANAMANASEKGWQKMARVQSSENNQDLTTNPPEVGAQAEDDASLSPTVAAVVRATAECGLRVHPLCASSVVDFIESRRGRNPRPVKVPTKYYPDAIRQSWPEIEKFIHENGLAS